VEQDFLWVLDSAGDSVVATTVAEVVSGDLVAEVLVVEVLAEAGSLIHKIIGFIMNNPQL
jgi:hypothetical protein